MKRLTLVTLGLVLAFARPAFAQDDDQGPTYYSNPTPQQPNQSPPPTTTTAPSEPDRRGEEDPAKKVRLSMRGALGYQYAPLNGVPVTGGRLRLGIGGQNDSSAHYAMINILYGSTQEGLRTWDVRVGWTGDFLRTGILRLGVDVEGGYLVVRRATFDDRMWALGISGGAHFGVDLYPFGPRNDHALMLEGRFDVHLHFGPAVMWGPTLLIGFRY